MFVCGMIEIPLTFMLRLREFYVISFGMVALKSSTALIDNFVNGGIKFRFQFNVSSPKSYVDKTHH